MLETTWKQKHNTLVEHLSFTFYLQSGQELGASAHRRGDAQRVLIVDVVLVHRYRPLSDVRRGLESCEGGRVDDDDIFGGTDVDDSVQQPAASRCLYHVITRKFPTERGKCNVCAIYMANKQTNTIKLFWSRTIIYLILK